MHAIELSGPDVESLRRIERPHPGRPGRRQVLLLMRAASFNFIDIAMVRGIYPRAVYPNIPIADGAGEVVEVGEDVTDLKVGDRVAVHPKAIWFGGRTTFERANTMRGVTEPGALEEFKLVDAAAVVKAPDHLDWAEIATLPIVFTTAWNGLVTAGIGAGSTIVVLGTGGTSLATLQLAKAQGARVIVTSSSDERLALAKRLGADEGINYRTAPNWHERVQDLTDGIGADMVLETAGAETFGRSLQAVRQGGTVFTIGFLSGGKAEADLMAIIVRALRVIGENTGSSDDLRRAMLAIGSAGIHPVLGPSFELADLKEAYSTFAAGGQFGKVTLEINW